MSKPKENLHSLLLFGLLCLQACALSESEPSNRDARMVNKLEGIWARASGYRELEVRSGNFKSLKIGQSPHDAIGALKLMGVSAIIPLQKRRVATNTEELELLRDAAAISVGTYCYLVFDGDHVVEANFAHQLPKGQDALRTATTRQDVFRVLGNIVGPSDSFNV